MLSAARLILCTVVICTLAQPAAAKDARSVSLSLGYGRIKADERFFDGGDMISHLTWSAEVPMATVQIRRDLPSDWLLTGSLSSAIGDGAYMSDLDWLAPDRADWTHRSLHPDTRLNHYVDADLAVGRDLHGPAGTTVNLHGGLRYTDVEWDAQGGSLVYSFDGFRDYRADLPDGPTVVTYRQQQLSLFAGVEADRQFGSWTLSGRVRGGVAIDPRETDRHWLRDLRFDRSHDTISFLDLAARVDYRLNDRATAFIQARHIHHEDHRGDTRYSSISSGDDLGRAGGNAGIGFSMTQLSVGVGHAF